MSTVEVAGAALKGVGVEADAAPPKENPVDAVELVLAPNKGAGAVLGLVVAVDVPKGDGVVVVDAPAPKNELEAPGMLEVELNVDAELVAVEAPPNKDGLAAVVVEAFPNNEFGLLAVFPNCGAGVVVAG